MTKAGAPGKGQWRDPFGDIYPLFGTGVKFSSPKAAGYAMGLSGVLGCSLKQHCLVNTVTSEQPGIQG